MSCGIIDDNYETGCGSVRSDYLQYMDLRRKINAAVKKYELETGLKVVAINPIEFRVSACSPMQILAFEPITQ